VKALSGCEWPSLTNLYMPYPTSDLGTESVRMLLNLAAEKIEEITVGKLF